MPAHRKPAAVLDARGAFDKNPDRRREDLKDDRPFPEVAPGNLSPAQVKAWHYVRKLIPDSVLAGADQASVELLACLWSEFTITRDDFPAAKITQMRQLMGEFGLTPAARAKLGTPTKKKGTGFEDV